MGATGLEPTSMALPEMPISKMGGAQCGAPRALSTIQDANLLRLIDAWPSLTKSVQQGILTVVEASMTQVTIK